MLSISPPSVAALLNQGQFGSLAFDLAPLVFAALYT
jgi:hypothetical protein